VTAGLGAVEAREGRGHQATAAEAAGFDAVPAVDTAPAKAVCAGCTFTDACQKYALTADVAGVWGGTDGEDRRRLRNEQGLPEPRRVSDDLDDLVRLWRTGRPDSTTIALSAA